MQWLPVRNRLAGSILLPLLLAIPACGENGANGWLRYAPLQTDAAQPLPAQFRNLPACIVNLDDSLVAQSAQSEAVRGMQGMLGRILRIEQGRPQEDSFILGTTAEVHRILPEFSPDPHLAADGYQLAVLPSHGHRYWIVAGANSRGILYGTFRLLDKVARRQDVTALREASSPSAPVRWVDQWDNLDGSIERGYAGRSIFFNQGAVRADLTRAGEYARLLASIGINGCNVNNVNADTRILTPAMLAQLARIADAFRPWGVRLSLSVDLSSPKAIGGLNTFDPADPKVIDWWQKKVDEIYRKIPDFAGFTVKADSEGQPGPSQYGRSPAEAANLLARALQPHGGLVLYRAFVYNHHLDWRNLKADRARAAYDIFQPLDGKFDANVIVQIKNGPIDFQVREPVSPLFAALRRTNQAIEVEVTQEYTGQQRHLVYLVPMWKQTLDFDLRAQNRSTPVKQIVEGKSFDRPTGGFVAVANVGLDTNWLHHPLAMANLYGFGRLAWNPDLTAASIAEDWTRLTFGNNPQVVRTIDAMLLSSWSAYEDYTGPLGLGTLTDIIGAHYGPGIASAERNGWGQWLRADSHGVGMDRTVATGTGYIGQYPPQVASMYESLNRCPDNLLLFMHHVAYSYRLHSGKTVIQHIYDSHYEGARLAAEYVRDWESLHDLIDEERYARVLALQQYQAGHSIVWRDAVCNWFMRMSGIPDAKGRVGHYPNRVEGESMRLNGYQPVAVTPWETASGGKAIVCFHAGTCSASFTFDRAAGWYDLAIQYFDQNNGISQYTVFLNRQQVGAWLADDDLPSGVMNGSTSTRHTLYGLALRPGDTIRIEGRPNGGEPAPLDYIQLDPQSR